MGHALFPTILLTHTLDGPMALGLGKYSVTYQSAGNSIVLTHPARSVPRLLFFCGGGGGGFSSPTRGVCPLLLGGANAAWQTRLDPTAPRKTSYQGARHRLTPLHESDKTGGPKRERCIWTSWSHGLGLVLGLGLGSCLRDQNHQRYPGKMSNKINKIKLN